MPGFKFHPIHILKRSNGQALTETALTMLLLLFLFIGVFDFVRLLNAYTVLNQAADEATRYASLPDGSRENGIPINQEFIKNRVTSLVKASGLLQVNSTTDSAIYSIAQVPTPNGIVPLDTPKLQIYIVSRSGLPNQNCLVQVYYYFDFSFLKLFESSAGEKSVIGNDSFTAKPFTSGKTKWTLLISATRTRSN